MGASNGTGPRGATYTACFTAQTLTTNPYDLFGLLTLASSVSNASFVELHEIRIGAYSTAAVSAAYTVPMTLLRGSTASSTSAAITPTHWFGSTSPAPLAAGSSVTNPSSGVVSTASAVVIHAGSWDISKEWVYRPLEEDRQRIGLAQRFHLRMGAPASALVVQGSLVFAEIGKNPTS